MSLTYQISPIIIIKNGLFLKKPAVLRQEKVRTSAQTLKNSKSVH